MQGNQNTMQPRGVLPGRVRGYVLVRDARGIPKVDNWAKLPEPIKQLIEQEITDGRYTRSDITQPNC